MIINVFKTALISLALGFITEIVNSWLGTPFLHKFFEDNLITILVALLAINAATMGIVLTKIRELIDKTGGAKFFTNTKRNMLLSVKEQIVLIGMSTITLSIKGAPVVSQTPNLPLLLNSLLAAIFIYALIILYDTAKGVLIIVDFNG